ncbi:hypothetical protein SAY86_004556 [Trapa natans]|uniref:Uncharacterized protein n=1 Tax=Trapa natans TaxID=22666 RepID=A0AAN7RFP0_TRANT|nr:hypothetical protein SAY86_004556 [Trapa natans]
MPLDWEVFPVPPGYHAGIIHDSTSEYEIDVALSGHVHAYEIGNPIDLIPLSSCLKASYRSLSSGLHFVVSAAVGPEAGGCGVRRGLGVEDGHWGEEAMVERVNE